MGDTEDADEHRSIDGTLKVIVGLMATNPTFQAGNEDGTSVFQG